MAPATVYSILLKKENAHEDPIYCCAWAKIKPAADAKGPSKDYIVTGGLDSLIKVWTYENNKLELLHTLDDHAMAVVSVAVSPDGHTLASTSLDCCLIIWDLLAGKKVHEIETGPTDVWQVAFSPCGTMVVSGSHTGKLVVYGIEKGTQEMVLDTREKFALSVSWSPNGNYIASGTVDGAVCIFDVAKRKVLHTIPASSKPVRSVAFSPKSHQLIAASDDGLVSLYTVASGNLQFKLDHKTWAVATCFSPDGTRVATATADGTVNVALADGLKVLNTFQEHNDSVWGLHFNAESNKLLSVSKDKNIIIYECPVLPRPAPGAKE